MSADGMNSGDIDRAEIARAERAAKRELGKRIRGQLIAEGLLASNTEVDPTSGASVERAWVKALPCLEIDGAGQRNAMRSARDGDSMPISHASRVLLEERDEYRSRGARTPRWQR